MPNTENRKHPTAKTATRRGRTDGDATRALILEAAGQLFAERGYQETTSKAICAKAGTNIAAVNYHFGSRDELYLAVMNEVMQHLLNLDYLARIAGSGDTPEQKLGQMIDGLVQGLIDERSWHPRVWAREILTPSPLIDRILETETLPRVEIAMPILAEITGLSITDVKLRYSLLGLMSPCLMLMVINPDLPTPLKPIFQRPAQEVAAHIKAFVMAGLHALAAEAR
ncbi:CerR family C-terminal domain-containing protein [Marinobacterium sp. D7]|uniref:TetR/AcrR family transcriptional regulator n=1 Tax=Marinobacterium ramblicola TaxID=2849041 RepID=UPI001C2D8E3C|nr:TetR/AcrR family transcriptional regulator [Marinobacterium ramblicola]MBV1786852.1 CerR family C-terminal domain-containing protein [Marinobacterium ramblicola]